MTTSLCVMLTAPSQSSVAVTVESSAAGTAVAHCTVTSAGLLVMIGAVVSLTVIVWVRLAALPQASVA